MNNIHNIAQLSKTIQNVHSELQFSAVNAVNKALTIRNWLIGYYIVEYEQNGADRAEYGDKVIESLAQKLNHINGIDKRSLFKFRQFYLIYPIFHSFILNFLQENSANFSQISAHSIVGSLTPQLEQNQTLEKAGSLTTLSKERTKSICATIHATIAQIGGVEGSH